MTFRNYNLLLLGSIAAIAALLCGATLYLQPVVGDLTRLGGYAENDFGWNGEQDAFIPPLASGAKLSAHYDIVVVGDSFSSRTTPNRQAPDGGFWADYLAQMTGQSVGVFDLDKTTVDDLIASPGFVATPPRLVIFENVERTLDIRFPGAAPACESATGPAPAIELHPLGVSPQRIPRSTFGGFSERRFNETLDHFRKSYRRWRGKSDGTPVLRATLQRADLFSHRRSAEILLIDADLGKRRWSAAQLDGFRCALHRYQGLVQANGKTAFVALIVPDKSTVYSDYLPGNLAAPHICPILAADRALRLVCTDAALKAAVASGIKDLYLPNDTHWASPGAKIAARAVADYVARGSGGQH
jgi:SGNH hydrolase-like domain, acetyltransferase AlgX